MLKFKSVKKSVEIAVLVVISFLFVAVVVYNFKVIGNAIGRIFSALTPFYIGFGIAYVLNRPLNAMESRFKLNRSLLIVCTYLVLIGAMLGFIRLFVPQIIENGGALIQSVKAGLLSLLVYFSELPYTSELLKLLDSQKEGIALKIGEMTNTYLAQLSQVLLWLAVMFLNVFFGIIISLYMLFDKHKILRLGKRLVETLAKEEDAKRFLDFMRTVNEIFSHFISGLIVEAVIVGVMAYIAMLFLDIRYALLLAFLITVTDVVPYIGPFIGAAPAVITTMTYDPVKAFWLAVAILVIQQLDANYIGPRVMGNYIGIDPIWVIFSITIGAALMGVLGILLAIPIGAIVKIVLDHVLDNISAAKGQAEKS